MGNDREQNARWKGWKGYYMLWPDANTAGSEAEQESSLELERRHQALRGLPWVKHHTGSVGHLVHGVKCWKELAGHFFRLRHSSRDLMEGGKNPIPRLLQQRLLN